MPMKTRSMSRRRMPSTGARKSYRKRVKNSSCRGHAYSSCIMTEGCKMSRGKKRSYCRKAKNTKRTRRA